MKVCCLVKEVPDAAVQKRLDPTTKRLDAGVRRTGAVDTRHRGRDADPRGRAVPRSEEIVAVTMGPETAVRALHKAVALGADRSVHLTETALEGSDVCATGYALAKVLEADQPDLVLLGQQSDDGECYTIGAVVARPSEDALADPGDQDRGRGRKARLRAPGRSTATTRSRSTCLAVISVGDAINEPRYPA